MGGGLLLLSFSLFSLVAIAKVQTQNCSDSQFTHGNSDLSSTVVSIRSGGFVYIVSDPPLSCGGYIIEWKLCYERERTASSYEIDLIVLRANTDISMVRNFTVVGFDRVTISTEALGSGLSSSDADSITRKCTQFTANPFIQFEEEDLLAIGILRSSSAIRPIGYNSGTGGQVRLCFPNTVGYSRQDSQIEGNLADIQLLTCDGDASPLPGGDKLDLQVEIQQDIIIQPTTSEAAITFTNGISIQPSTSISDTRGFPPSSSPTPPLSGGGGDPATSSPLPVIIGAVVAGVVIVVLVVPVVILVLCLVRRRRREKYAVQEQSNGQSGPASLTIESQNYQYEFTVRSNGQYESHPNYATVGDQTISSSSTNRTNNQLAWPYTLEDNSENIRTGPHQSPTGQLPLPPGRGLEASGYEIPLIAKSQWESQEKLVEERYESNTSLKNITPSRTDQDYEDPMVSTNSYAVVEQNVEDEYSIVADALSPPPHPPAPRVGVPENYFEMGDHRPSDWGYESPSGGEQVIPFPHLTSPIEEDIYWAPPNSEKMIYETLKRKRFSFVPKMEITILSKLGEGNFATVYLAQWRNGNSAIQVAVKKLKVSATINERVTFLKEAAVMGQFHHRNIVHLYGVVQEGEESEEDRWILLELLQNGDLITHLKSLKEGIHNSTIKPHDVSHKLLEFTHQIASGMNYLYNKSFIHRDLAARNILLDARYTCKIGDFGMSRDLESNDYYKSSGGLVPVKWTAPEALAYRKYTTASDVWSFGCLLFEMWSLGNKPLYNIKLENVYRELMKGYRTAPPPGCPRTVYTIMIECWHPNPEKRPTFGSLYVVFEPKNHLQLLLDNESQSALLGDHLSKGTSLFIDLQSRYK